MNDETLAQRLTGRQDGTPEQAQEMVNALAEAASLAESQNQALQEALEQTSQIQPRVLAMLRREGFKFETPLDHSEGWEKLAFTLYSTICEVDSIARNALSPTQETDPNPIGEPGVDWVDADHPCKRCGQIMPHTHDLRPTQETDPE